MVVGLGFLWTSEVVVGLGYLLWTSEVVVGLGLIHVTSNILSGCCRFGIGNSCDLWYLWLVSSII